MPIRYWSNFVWMISDNFWGLNATRFSLLQCYESCRYRTMYSGGLEGASLEHLHV